ncbi:MAG: redoxin domain-containing protein [Candidatus Saccharimonadales bacterium]
MFRRVLKIKAKLDKGHRAPSFRTRDVFGRPVDSADYSGGFVLLVFLRYAGCPWCNLAIHRLSLEQKLLKQENCQVVAFIQSSQANITSNIYDRHTIKPPFPVIADPKLTIYKLYGVSPSLKLITRNITDIPYWVRRVKASGFSQGKIDGNLFLVPAYFLVSAATGKIIKADRSLSFYDHETFTEIYSAISQAKVTGNL